MPCRSIIDKEGRLVISIGWDRLTYAEMDAQQEQLLSDPDFNPEFDHLMDARSVTPVDASVDQVKMLVGRKLFSSSSRRAWIAKEPHVFAMFRMATVYNEMSDARSNLRAFYSLSLALEWLGLKRLPDAIKSEGAAAKAEPPENDKAI